MTIRILASIPEQTGATLTFSITGASDALIDSPSNVTVYLPPTNNSLASDFDANGTMDLVVQKGRGNRQANEPFWIPVWQVNAGPEAAPQQFIDLPGLAKNERFRAANDFMRLGTAQIVSEYMDGGSRWVALSRKNTYTSHSHPIAPRWTAKKRAGQP